MTLPFIISIPHCSAEIPEDIRGSLALSQHQVIESVDFGTLEIFGKLPTWQIIPAQWSRLIVDLNRAPDQVETKGIAALTDYHGRSVYRPGQEPDKKTITRRVARFHRPYHQTLEDALSQTEIIGLIDAHSLNGTGPADAPDPGQRRKDVTLSNNGDLNGAIRPDCGPTTCSQDQIQLFKKAFEGQGLSVSINSPYQGGYISHHYGRKLIQQGRFAIQIEMNQDLYMRPGDLAPEKQRIKAVTGQVLEALRQIQRGLSHEFSA